MDFDERIENAGTLASEPDRDSIVAAIQELDGVLGRPDLTPTQRLTALTTLVQAQRNLGDHRAAIRTWIRIRPFIRTMEDPVHAVWLQQLAGSSFSDLGRHGLACSIFTTAIDRLERLDASASVRSAVLMEAGKAFKQSGDTIRARLCWEQAITLLRGDSEAAYDYARVESNLGALLLEHPNDEEQARGVKMIEDAMGVKARLGDLVGLSTSYSALGAYYLNRGRFQRGIAFTRLDLHISRAIGNRHAIALSLINLAGIYIRFLQLNPARMLLREARQIGDDLNNKRLVSRIDTLSLAVEAAGRSAGKARKRVGPGANCACGSGNPYQDCCGRADFEPVDGLPEFLGFSEDVRLITHEMQDAGGRPSHLDYVLRVTDLAERRNSWVDMTVHDGWAETFELADMANQHLMAAKTMAIGARSDPDGVSNPLACAILSVSALEAFVNQTAYFLSETQESEGQGVHSVPPELAKGALDFQRYTPLENKWHLLGRALCGDAWPPPQSIWGDVQLLIDIRNELVHFKSESYERISPPPPHPHPIIRRVPPAIQMRPMPRSWAARLLTPSFADWCVRTTEELLLYFKQRYRQQRLESHLAPVTGTKQ